MVMQRGVATRAEAHYMRINALHERLQDTESYSRIISTSRLTKYGIVNYSNLFN